MLRIPIVLATLVFGWLTAPSLASAQVAAASVGGKPALYVGGFYSNFNSDYNGGSSSSMRLSGAGVYVDWDLFGRLGAEGEVRFLRFNQSYDFHSDHYLAGPKYSMKFGKYRPYAKLLLGAGEINYPYSLAYGGYFSLVPGGGLDYRIGPRINARADYEYQFWPSAPGLPGLPSSGLNPNGFSVGIGYRIF
ncbi:MAG TPA: outer membrane beta-barrel protein [Acidisarcina sp.]